MTIPPSLAQPSIVQAPVETVDPNAISKTIMDAKGDLISATGADTPARLAVGADGQVLVADSTQSTGLKWAVDPTTTSFDAKGDLLVGTGPDAYVRVPVGTNNQVLVADSGEASGVRWSSEQDPNAIVKSIVDAKGDLIAATANDTPARLGVGTDTHLLIADSTQATGLKWGRPDIVLGTETTGNYIAGITGGTGVTVTGSGSEGATPSVAIGQSVGTVDTVAFGGLNVDSGTLYVDAANNRVGVNTISPLETLHVNGTIHAAGFITALGVTATDFTGNLSGAVQFDVKNLSGGTLAAGTPVYISGTVGASGIAEVKASRADTASTMPAVGILETSLNANQTGHAMIIGSLEGLNTSSYTLNQPLYVGSAGGLTATRPTGASDAVQVIAYAARINSSTGVLIVNAYDEVRTPNSISVSGNIATTLGQFTGSGAGLTSIPAGQLTGTVAASNIGNDTVALGTKTTGDYVATVAASTGVTVSGGTGESSTATISIGQAVATTDSPQFAGVTATGTVSANAVSVTNGVGAASATISGTTATSVLTVDGIEIDTTGATSNQVLKYNGTKFTPSTGASVTISDTPPISPTPQAGDQWYESDTGRTFIYYDSVWVEIGNATDIAGAIQPSQVTALSAVTSLSSDDVFVVVDNPSGATAANKITYGNFSTAISNTLAPGLVYITGTTVTSGSSTTVVFNNCFSSTYDNYRIIIDNFFTSTGNRGLNLRLRASGSDATGSNYNNVFHGLTMAAAASNFTGTTDYASTGVYNSSNTLGLSHCSMDVFSPNKAERTYAQVQSILYDSQWITRNGLWQHDLTTAYDGFTLLLSSTGNITQVRVRVYGYRNS